MLSELLSIIRQTSPLIINHIKVVHRGKTICHLIRNMSSLNSVPKVDIDPSGVFKYILIKVHDPAKKTDEPCLVIVRGYKRCNYHSDIYEEVQKNLNHWIVNLWVEEEFHMNQTTKKSTFMVTHRDMGKLIMKLQPS